MNSKHIPNGTKVIVTPQTLRGRDLPSYAGMVKDIRIGVKGIFSVEYLVEQDGGYSTWVYASFVAPSKVVAS